MTTHTIANRPPPPQALEQLSLPLVDSPAGALAALLAQVEAYRGMQAEADARWPGLDDPVYDDLQRSIAALDWAAPWKRLWRAHGNALPEGLRDAVLQYQATGDRSQLARWIEAAAEGQVAA